MNEKGNYCYEYPRPALTTDCVIFGFDGVEIKILLIERGTDPFKGKWALPGGFVNMDEDTEACARRELFEETGIKDLFIEQLYTFSDVNRDPRGRVVSVSYYALVKIADYEIQAGDDASKAKWFSMSDVPSLAFDHDRILRVAFQRLKSKIRYQPVGFELLNEQFTMRELQSLYEAILEVQLDRRNFYKKIMKMEILIPTQEKEANTPHRAGRYYRFDREKYQELSNKGFNFEL
ncbi:NUDIX hydrolase [Marinilabiliaceae bacterium JC017]|nr:NUDIX hydrolase [Marinilabiliaceae bacterium JC017]